MFKKFLTSFRIQTVRSLVGLYGKGTNYLVYRSLKPSNLSLNLKQNKPIVLVFSNSIKAKGGRTGKRAEVNEKELAEAFDIEELREDFLGPVQHFKAQLKQQTQDKPIKHFIENFQFEFDGDTVKVGEVAQIGKKSATRYILHFDGTPNAIPEFFKALQSSNLNWSIQQEGTKIHLEVPKPIKDNRHILKKQSKMYLNACKEELLLIQNKYLMSLNKQDALGLELKFKLQDQLHTLTDELLLEAEKHLEEKLVELQKELD